jgi:hypothetical protein
VGYYPEVIIHGDGLYGRVLVCGHVRSHQENPLGHMEQFEGVQDEWDEQDLYLSVCDGSYHPETSTHLYDTVPG